VGGRRETLDRLFKPILEDVGPAHLPHQEPAAVTPEPSYAFPTKLNIVIQIVGSRGDVQPFVALGKVLRSHGHRVRLATHPTFKGFVEDNGLEFYSIGGDPAQLMAFMVKNPRLLPGVESLRAGDVGKRRKEMAEIIDGCWRSCVDPGDGSRGDFMDGLQTDVAPFIADAIIANPPSFAHIHCAEKLRIPLHVMFT
jgi:UDP:flavonoid glycosyltransferase YjiC (YdhE family)